MYEPSPEKYNEMYIIQLISLSQSLITLYLFYHFAGLSQPHVWDQVTAVFGLTKMPMDVQCHHRVCLMKKIFWVIGLFLWNLQNVT